MFARCRQSINSFRSDERGAVAILFSLMTIVLTFMAGMAIDYARILNMRDRIASAVDAASLAAGQAMLKGDLSDQEVNDLAKAYFDQNVAKARAMGIVEDPTIVIDRTNSTVSIDAVGHIRMTLTRLGGFDEMELPVTSQSVFQQRDIEVGMALDITGSMSEWAGGERKIDGLKRAFETFANRLIPDNPSEKQKVRVGVAPYSAAVNLGNWASVVSDGKSQDGCVIERKSGAHDDGTSVFAVKADAASNKSKYSCPSNAIIPLSDDKANLIAKVKSFSTGGNTAGHLGAQWAWNLISEQWASTWGTSGAPDQYSLISEDKLIKAVVLMTDGEFNTSYRGGSSATQAVSLCDVMKAKGVKVFSVVFGSGANAAAVDTLQKCASPGSGYFANASNGAELEAAFERFAGQLTALRLAK